MRAIVELCCQVSFWSRSFQHICWWENYELTLLILIIDLTLKKQSRHVFTKSQASFYIKFSNFSGENSLEMSDQACCSTTNGNFSLKGVRESTFWAVHNHVIANETSLHHLFCALQSNLPR